MPRRVRFADPIADDSTPPPRSLPQPPPRNHTAASHPRQQRPRRRFRAQPRFQPRPPAQPASRRRRQVRHVTTKEFKDFALPLLKTLKIDTLKFIRRFRAVFGMPPRLVTVLWDDIVRKGFLDHLGPRSLKPVHLLWALMFLKCYNKEEVNGVLVGCDEKTFRKWSWFYCDCIANLDTKYIKWQNRFRGGDKGNRCLAVVDGTDFRIGEPVPFQKVWWGHKYNGPAVRYELATSLHNGDICWFNGPYAPKVNPDITIFRHKLKHILAYMEQVICDKGYKGDLRCCTPLEANDRHHLKAMSVARARHETVNRYLKRWSILQSKFRHHRSKHHIIFRAVVVLTQLCFENGYRPFQLNDWIYTDPVLPDFY